MIISNSTPLINFSAIQRLDILARLFDKIVIPKAVERELLDKGQFYPSATALKRVMFIETHVVRNIILCDAFRAELNAGEAEAIALALELKATWLLMDELHGRSIAKSYDLDCIGSIGCLVEAKRKGIIPAIKPLLDAMRTQARYWVHPKLYALILQENGE